MSHFARAVARYLQSRPLFTAFLAIGAADAVSKSILAVLGLQA